MKNTVVDSKSDRFVFISKEKMRPRHLVINNFFLSTTQNTCLFAVCQNSHRSHKVVDEIKLWTKSGLVFTALSLLCPELFQIETHSLLGTPYIISNSSIVRLQAVEKFTTDTSQQRGTDFLTFSNFSFTGFGFKAVTLSIICFETSKALSFEAPFSKTNTLERK